MTKASPFDFQQFEHFIYDKWCLCGSILAHEPNVVAIEFQMVSWTPRRPFLCPSEGRKYGVSILRMAHCTDLRLGEVVYLLSVYNICS